MGTGGYFSGGKTAKRMKLTTYLPLVLRSRTVEFYVTFQYIFLNGVVLN
jgi:hypothetical protein